MKYISILALAFSFFSFSTFGADKITIAPADNTTTVAGVISMYSEWIKDKGKKYDISFTMKNEHDKAIIVLLGEMHCFHGPQEGDLKHTFFNTGERTINFGVSQTKNNNMVCVLREQATGPYKITIANIYENPSGDGKTLGKVLAKDVVWKVLVANK